MYNIKGTDLRREVGVNCSCVIQMTQINVCVDHLVISGLIPDPETQGVSTKAVKKVRTCLSIWQRRIYYLSGARGTRCVNKEDKQLVQKQILQDLE